MGNEDLKKLSETPHTDAARKISAMDRYAGEVAFGILAENLERKCAALQQKVETLRRWRECVISALVVSHIYRAEHDSRPEEAINELLSWECATALDPSVSKQARELVARARQEALEEAAKACARIRHNNNLIWRGTTIADPDHEMAKYRSEGADACEYAIRALQQHAGESEYVRVPREPTDEWAEAFCAKVNWRPNGTKNEFVEGRIHTVTFRELAKDYIRAVIDAALEDGETKP